MMNTLTCLFSVGIPEYQLEGDGYETKIIVNSIARFRLRLVSLEQLSNSNNLIDSFSISMLDPLGHAIVVQRRLLSADLLELTYQPMSIGQYQLSVAFNGIIDRQLIIDVIDDETNSLTTYQPFGPGLQRGLVDLPTEFYIKLQSNTIKTINEDHLQFSMEPGFHAELDYEQQMATVRYIPTVGGPCPIRILQSNRDIPQSPFMAHIRKMSFAHETPRVSVHGLSKNIVIHRPVEFQVKYFIINFFHSLE